MMDRIDLPDLHKQAKIFKNKKRFQHDGGRAWIKDGQLQESRAGANYFLKTVSDDKPVTEGEGRRLLEKEAGAMVEETDTGRKM